MAVTTTNLGVITAYGDAVAAGYTGTKAEWQALMASYATVGQQAVDAKNAAVAAKDTAVAKATEATTAATTATTKANEASASAQSIAQSASQIQENTDDIAQLKSGITNIASVDGVIWTNGYFLSPLGAVVPYEPYSYSDYIPTNQENGNRFDLYFEVWGNNLTCVVYYDAYKNILQIDPIGTSGAIVKYTGCTKNVTGCEFVRLSNLTEKTPVVLLANIQDFKVSVSLDNLDTDLTNLLFKPTDFRNLNVDFTANPDHYLQEDGTLVSFDHSNVSNIIEIPSDSSGYIRVTGYKFYGATICVFYDASQTPIDYYPHTAEQTLIVSNQIVKIPKTAKYFRFCDNSYRTTISTTVIEISTGMGVSNNVWNGKKWVCVGDSLTEVNSKTTKHYFDYVSDATGISVVNMGVSGTGYANGQGTGNAFYQRISNMPTDADVVTIFGSFNDMAAGIPIGTVTDSGTDTIAGCINTTINNLFEVFPLVNLGIVTPTPWTGYNPWNGSAVGNEYVQMIIDICKKRGLMCLDLYHCSELRPWQSSFLPLAYSKDNGGGTHPDEKGHSIIAPKFQGFLNSLLLH